MRKGCAHLHMHFKSPPRWLIVNVMEMLQKELPEKIVWE